MNKNDARIKAQFNAVRITKVHLGDEVEILYEDPDGLWKASMSMPLDEVNGARNAPSPEFKNALSELVPAVCEICEYDKKETPTFTVKGISLKYKGEEKEKVMGVNITATKKLLKTKASMTINTPYLPETAKGGAAKLTPDAALQIWEVVNQARLYLSGERAQAGMEFKDKK